MNNTIETNFSNIEKGKRFEYNGDEFVKITKQLATKSYMTSFSIHSANLFPDDAVVLSKVIVSHFKELNIGDVFHFTNEFNNLPRIKISKNHSVSLHNEDSPEPTSEFVDVYPVAQNSMSVIFQHKKASVTNNSLWDKARANVEFTSQEVLDICNSQYMGVESFMLALKQNTAFKEALLHEINDDNFLHNVNKYNYLLLAFNSGEFDAFIDFINRHCFHMCVGDMQDVIKFVFVGHKKHFSVEEIITKLSNFIDPRIVEYLAESKCSKKLRSHCIAYLMKKQLPVDTALSTLTFSKEMYKLIIENDLFGEQCIKSYCNDTQKSLNSGVVGELLLLTDDIEFLTMMQNAPILAPYMKDIVQMKIDMLSNK